MNLIAGSPITLRIRMTFFHGPSSTSRWTNASA